MEKQGSRSPSMDRISLNTGHAAELESLLDEIRLLEKSPAVSSSTISGSESTTSNERRKRMRDRSNSRTRLPRSYRRRTSSSSSSLSSSSPSSSSSSSSSGSRKPYFVDAKRERERKVALKEINVKSQRRIKRLKRFEKYRQEKWEKKREQNAQQTKGKPQKPTATVKPMVKKPPAPKAPKKKGPSQQGNRDQQTANEPQIIVIPVPQPFPMHPHNFGPPPMAYFPSHFRPLMIPRQHFAMRNGFYGHMPPMMGPRGPPHPFMPPMRPQFHGRKHPNGFNGPVRPFHNRAPFL